MAKKFLVTGLALVLAVSFAQAATLTLTAKVVGATDAEGNPIEYVTNADQTQVLSGAAGTYEIAYSFNISGLAAGQQGFGNMAFNVALPAGITPGYDFNWDASGYVGDVTRMATASATMWGTNGDIGLSGTDLQGIVVELNAPYTTSTSDYRRIVGQDPYVTGAAGRNNGGFVGRMFVAWGGSTGSDTYEAITTDLYQFSTITTPNTDLTQNMKFVLDANGTRITNPVLFATVPEPATMALLGLGALGALLRRRSK